MEQIASSIVLFQVEHLHFSMVFLLSLNAKNDHEIHGGLAPFCGSPWAPLCIFLNPAMRATHQLNHLCYQYSSNEDIWQS